MGESSERRCTAFEGTTRVAAGGVARVAAEVKAILDRSGERSVLIFDDVTSEVIEIDFRGTPGDVMDRLPVAPGQGLGTVIATGAAREAPRGPGRPRLGVVGREVTLLPRHWEWLNGQPGGASVALRRLVDEARHASEGADRLRRAQEAAYRFMSAMAGDQPGFEEATRALFAGDASRFDAQVSAWPADIRDHATRLAEAAFEARASVAREGESGRS
jgi:hypothetical protein